jgi:hypothetical protein
VVDPLTREDLELRIVEFEADLRAYRELVSAAIHALPNGDALDEDADR